MLYLASDHAGFKLKEEIKQYLVGLGMEVEDTGAYSFDKDDDYPDFIIPAAEKVSKNPEQHKAIIFGASGQGEAMAANKVQGIRAALYYGGPLDLVGRSRSHNNANVLSLGARFLTSEQAKEAVKLWLKTPFEGERHERRIEKIQEFEQKR